MFQRRSLNFFYRISRNFIPLSYNRQRYFSTKDTIDKKLGFIGAGNMGNAIIEALLNKELVTPKQLYISEPREHIVSYWIKKGAKASIHNSLAAEEGDVVFLSVKPAVLAQAVAEISHKLNNPNKIKNKLFVSILAGVTIDSIKKVLAGSFEGRRVIRVMPNIAMMLGQGCAAYCTGKSATKEDIRLVHQIFSSCGICSLLPERLMDAECGLAGCGPAYIYLLIEGLADGAVKMGLPRDMSTRFAAQTALGAATMVLKSGKHPGVLKDEVCSPGGSTIAGVHALEKKGLRSTMMDAVEAATLKSIELGKK